MCTIEYKIKRVSKKLQKEIKVLIISYTFCNNYVSWEKNEKLIDMKKISKGSKFKKKMHTSRKKGPLRYIS